MKRLRVGVLFGGRSGEHEISLVSAASVLNGLDRKKYSPVPVGITREGEWVLPQLPRGKRSYSHTDLRLALEKGAPVRLDLDSHGRGLVTGGAKPKAQRLDVIFPVLHGTFGEDGTIQGLLELAGIAYVGAGVLGSSVGMDKETQKRLFLQAGLPVAPYLLVRRGEWKKARRKTVAEIEKHLRFPVFVKPAVMGSSIGISKVKNAATLIPAIDLAAQYSVKILVEKAINAREIELAVLGNNNPEASLPGEVLPRREFYDYQAKYLEDTTELRIPVRLSRTLTAGLQQMAVSAFRAADCEGMARVDFLVEKRTDKIFVNEINTIPGFTPISMYPKLWEVSGLRYPRLLDRLIGLALERHRETRATRYTIRLPKTRGGVLKE